MFEKGDFIVYGNAGVCEVLDVTTMDMSGVPADKLYYFLKPCGKKDSEIFTPVDNTKTVMREIVSDKEANFLLEEIPSLEEFQVTNEKFREDSYKQCVRNCDSREMMKLIKTLCARKHDRMVQGKNFPSTDEKYLKFTSDALMLELSIALKQDKDELKEKTLQQMTDMCIA